MAILKVNQKDMLDCKTIHECEKLLEGFYASEDQIEMLVKPQAK
jgi:hypothetical protein